MKRLGESEFLHERYPEMSARARESLTNFDFLASYVALRNPNEWAAAHWAIPSDGAHDLCERLGSDRAFRNRVGQAIVSLDGDAFVDELLHVFGEAREKRRTMVPGNCHWSSDAIYWLNESVQRSRPAG